MKKNDLKHMYTILILESCYLFIKSVLTIYLHVSVNHQNDHRRQHRHPCRFGLMNYLFPASAIFMTMNCILTRPNW